MAAWTDEPPRQIPDSRDVRIQAERVRSDSQEEATVDTRARPERRAYGLPPQPSRPVLVGQQEGRCHMRERGEIGRWEVHHRVQHGRVGSMGHPQSDVQLLSRRNGGQPSLLREAGGYQRMVDGASRHPPAGQHPEHRPQGVRPHARGRDQVQRTHPLGSRRHPQPGVHWREVRREIVRRALRPTRRGAGRPAGTWFVVQPRDLVWTERRFRPQRLGRQVPDHDWQRRDAAGAQVRTQGVQGRYIHFGRQSVAGLHNIAT